MSRQILSVIFWGFLLAILSACKSDRKALIEGAPLISKHLKDGFGRNIELRSKPKRVVSLAPHITETLFALGEGKSLAARSNLCEFPVEALDLPEVDIYPELDLSAVVTHQPDLILASGEYHQPAMAAFFDKYRIPLFFLNPKSLEDVVDGIRSIGEIMDQQERAGRLCDSLTRKIAQVSDSTSGQIKYSTAMIVSVEPLRAVGGGGFQNDMLQKAGAKNVFGAMPDRYPVVTPAQIIQAAPEYLLIASDDNQAYAKLVEISPELHLMLPAAQNKHVYQVEPGLMMTPGPRILESLYYLTRILHARINLESIQNP